MCIYDLAKSTAGTETERPVGMCEDCNLSSSDEYHRDKFFRLKKVSLCCEELKIQMNIDIKTVITDN